MHTCVFVSRGKKSQFSENFACFVSIGFNLSFEVCNNKLNNVNYVHEQKVYGFVFFCYIRKYRTLSFIAFICIFFWPLDLRESNMDILFLISLPSVRLYIGIPTYSLLAIMVKYLTKLKIWSSYSSFSLKSTKVT